MERQLLILADLSSSLSTSEESFSFLQVYLKQSMPRNLHDSMAEISRFFSDINLYVSGQVRGYVAGDETITQEEILYHIETFNKGIEYLIANLNVDIFYEGNYEEVKNHWKILAREIITQFPDNSVFNHYGEWWF
ncbi:hypothetical protein DS745_07045 [Anaerobacillus alkaliphilus]|uniref:Uncharacterized protein n=1 Tax=Anaerobacillus alkaliphilus TaxID=1548597 RepID=A0A4Q0VVC3_9BACI|nr:hypothetical protein [Anaerobacillus alkaliphilus]RXJ02452.1 hypothetical protein DS745_07045 [Anaerobacillus alkaliphilus]